MGREQYPDKDDPSGEEERKGPRARLHNGHWTVAAKRSPKTGTITDGMMK
jgi:hypothetical protein